MIESLTHRFLGLRGAPASPRGARRVIRNAVALLMLIQAVAGCQEHMRHIIAGGGPLIAYTLPKSTPWFQPGDVSFVVTKGQTAIKTWTKHVESSRFGGFSRPAFTADGKYAFSQYADEQVGRYPYDGGDIRAELAWVDVTTGETHEVAVGALSRTAAQPPSRPGNPYALQGSTVVWQAPTPAKSPDGQVVLMQLDLSRPNPQPTILRTVQLPPRTPEQQAVPYRNMDFTGDVVGADHGRVAIAKKYDTDTETQADHLFLVDGDGTIGDLGHLPTREWVTATFSPDGTRMAYETGKYSQPGACGEHQVTVFDTATGHPAADFPPAPFDATPKPYFYGNVNAAVWWTTNGKLRAAAGVEKCPTNTSEITPDGGVWELRASEWTQIDPAGTYRDYPLPSGDVVVMAKAAASTDSQTSGQASNGTAVFARIGGQLVHVADADAADVAVAYAQ